MGKKKRKKKKTNLFGKTRIVESLFIPYISSLATVKPLVSFNYFPFIFLLYIDCISNAIIITLSTISYLDYWSAAQLSPPLHPLMATINHYLKEAREIS